MLARLFGLRGCLCKIASRKLLRGQFARRPLKIRKLEAVENLQDLMRGIVIHAWHAAAPAHEAVAALGTGADGELPVGAMLDNGNDFADQNFLQRLFSSDTTASACSRLDEAACHKIAQEPSDHRFRSIDCGRNLVGRGKAVFVLRIEIEQHPDCQIGGEAELHGLRSNLHANRHSYVFGCATNGRESLKGQAFPVPPG